MIGTRPAPGAEDFVHPSGTRAALIRPDDPRWSAVLARVRHDLYHLPAYNAVAARHEGGTARAFYAEWEGEAFLLPLLIRDLPAAAAGAHDARDATSPYGYPGPVCTRPEESAFVARCLEAFAAVAREHGLVTAFLRLHPLLPLPEAALAAQGTLVRHGPVAYIDLTESADALWSQTRPNHRTGIHKLERAGFIPVVDDWSHFAAFRAVYAATMRRVGAADFYFFSDAYFEDLRAALGGGALHLVSVVAPGGAVAAAGLFTVVDGIVEYHLGGTADAYLAQAPSKLMFHAARGWAKANGGALLNLGGGLGGVPGPLLNFKAGFARMAADFLTLRIVLDAARYRELNAAAGATGAHDADYFPRYRQPRPAAAGGGPSTEYRS